MLHEYIISDIYITTLILSQVLHPALDNLGWFQVKFSEMIVEQSHFGLSGTLSTAAREYPFH